MHTPDFRPPRFGRRGYDPAEVDAFVALVAACVDGAPDGDAITAGDVRAMVFHSAPKGQKGYAADEVDDWLQQVAPEVAAAERMHRSDGAAPTRRANTVVEMAAPPHFADHFPRVSRALMGYSVADVDRLLEDVYARLRQGVPVSEMELLRPQIGEQQGGYRQSAVMFVLELIALGLRR
jgi:DivIVA domain-containing protein